jgi:hypothetical protein
MVTKVSLDSNFSFHLASDSDESANDLDGDTALMLENLIGTEEVTRLLFAIKAASNQHNRIVDSFSKLCGDFNLFMGAVTIWERNRKRKKVCA